MRDFLTRQLRNQITQALLDSADANTFFLHRPTGRLFDIRPQGNGTFYVTDALPNTKPLADAISGNPNASANLIAQRKLDRSELIFVGGQIDQGAVCHDDFEAMLSAIVTAIESNTLLAHAPPRCAAPPSPIDDARLAVREAQDAVEYWRRCAEPLVTRGTILEGAHNVLGPLNHEARQRVLAFLNAPSADTWSVCYSLCVVGFRTLWEVWCEHDVDAPRSLGADGTWSTHPEPESLLTWLHTALASKRCETQERLKEAERALECAERRLSGCLADQRSGAAASA